MRPLLTLLLLCFFCTCGRAQTNWQPGYIVSLDGTRTEGEINAIFTEEYMKSIQFRNTSSSSIQTLEVAELMSFGSKGISYQVHDISVNASPRSTPKLVMAADMVTEENRGALLELISGDVTLLEYRDKLEQAQFFLIKGKEAPRYLPFARYLVETEGGGRRLRRDKAYLLVLNEVLGDCGSLLPKIQHTEYEPKDMMKLVLDYYSCTGTSPDHKKVKGKGIFSFGVAGGLSYRSYARIIPAPPMLVFNWGESIDVLSPMIGFEAQYKPSPYGSFSLKAAGYYIYSSTNKQKDTSQPGTSTISERRLAFSASTINIFLGGAYRIKKGKYPISLEAGVIISKVLNIDDVRYSTINALENRTFVYYGKPLGWGLYGGVSMDFSPITLSIRYETQELRKKIDYSKVFGPSVTVGYQLK